MCERDMSHRPSIAVIDCINIYAVPLHRVRADSYMLPRVKTKANLFLHQRFSFLFFLSLFLSLSFYLFPFFSIVKFISTFCVSLCIVFTINAGKYHVGIVTLALQQFG